MPDSVTLDKDWIDQNYSYLEPRIGSFPVFEPSAGFYEDLAATVGTDKCMTIAGYPVRQLFSHVHLAEVNVSFEDHIKNAGEFRFSQQAEKPEIIVPVCIRIADKYRHIKDPRHRGMAIGTILAHEIAHYAMMKKQIRRDTTDNERLTDLGLIVLGFGKLWFNGRDLVVGDRSEQLGYLKPLDMTYAFMEYAQKNKITEERLRTGLTPEARRFFSFWLGKVTTELRHYQRQEASDKAKDIVQELAAHQVALEADGEKISLAITSLETSLAMAAENQEIINRTHHFWDILPEDHRVMAAFVTARSTGAQETELSFLTRSLVKPRQDLHDLGIGLQQPAAETMDPAWYRKVLKSSHKALTGIESRSNALRQQAGIVSSAHERCFAQMDQLRRELQETRTEITKYTRQLRDIRRFHQFLTENPASWRAYPDDTELYALASWLTRPDTQNPFGDLEQEMRVAEELVCLPRQQYADTLGRYSSLRKVRDRLRHERNCSARAHRAMGEILTAQERIRAGYLEGSRRCESHLHDLRISCAALTKDIGSLKPRQDRIFAGHDRLSVTENDGEEFIEITRAILSCSPEGEVASCTRRLEEVSMALSGDVERVRSRKQSKEILPLETHETALKEARHNLGLLERRIAHWKQVQQGYIDQLDAMERTSAGNLLRRTWDTIRSSAGASITKKNR